MQKAKPYLIGIGAAVVVIGIALLVLFTALGAWPVVLDIVLVITALVSLVLLAALIYAVLALTRTIVD
ncbi:MAG TPA: hypothetical protein VGS80_14795, partial [Ktedonobacterales bacterium]|nr:hypothetical protein [Ktedonobacterales bacterium]